VGVALFFNAFGQQENESFGFACFLSEYYMSKNKIELTPQIDVDAILVAMTEKYKNEDITTIDGVKIDFANEWVHLKIKYRTHYPYIY
jgi:phosphomannomutase